MFSFVPVCQTCQIISILERMDLENLALRPNCLLTRSPLVFVSGPRSLFSPEPMAAELRQFIQAHGYQVAPLWMPFRSDQQRRKTVQQWLQQNQTKSFHFFMADQTWLELQPVFERCWHPHSTLNLIRQPSDIPASLTLHTRLEKMPLTYFEVPRSVPPLRYRLHTLFCALMNSRAVHFEQTLLQKNRALYDRFLDHCIELAENEYKDSTSRM